MGKYILSRSNVLYPENEAGCWDAIQRYNSVDLDTVRTSLYRAVEVEDPDAILSCGKSLEVACDNAWEDAEKYGWLVRAAGVAPMVSVGIIGAVASGIPGVGVLSSLGMGMADRFLRGRVESSAIKGIGRLLGKSHMFSIYRFKHGS